MKRKALAVENLIEKKEKQEFLDCWRPGIRTLNILEMELLAFC